MTRGNAIERLLDDQRFEITGRGQAVYTGAQCRITVLAPSCPPYGISQIAHAWRTLPDGTHIDKRAGALEEMCELALTWAELDRRRTA